MKQITLVIFAVCTVTIFYACGSGGSNTGKETAASEDSILNAEKNLSWITNIIDNSCVSGLGMGNFILSDGKADSMREHFDETYGKYPVGGDRIQALQREYWINACTISSISSFLKKSGNYDGIRIHFAASTQPTSGNGTPYTNQTTILIYPTVTTSVVGKHKDSFVLITPVTTGCSLSYIESYTTAQTKIAKFERMYHSISPAPDPNDNSKYSLSKSVWIEACVIGFMESLIKNSPAKLDGIRVYTAAYLGTETRRPYGADAMQASTIIMVPTSPNGTTVHQDRWDVINEAKSAFDKKDKSIFGALNHGELCPNACGDK